LKVYLLVLLFIMCDSVWAQSSSRLSNRKSDFVLSRSSQNRVKKLSLVVQNYTGPEYTSFSDGSSGYGAEISTDDGGRHFRYFFRARFNRSQGKQDFRKSNTVYTSEYDFMSFEPEMGISLYPVARSEKGMNIYVWGSGHLSYNYLEIKSIPNNVTGVDSKSQDFGSGYGGGVGVEFVLGGMRASGVRSSGKLMVLGEVGFRENFAPLAGLSSFEISGMTVSLGVGF
jgi:hypothetical protein